VTQRKIDSAFVHNIVATKGYSPAYKAVENILPIVLFEVMALGQDALHILGVRSAKLHLRDGEYYKIKYSHLTHSIVLYRMRGTRNATLVASFNNASSQLDVFHALHPAVAAENVA
jgi:hypothetical protein